MAGLGRGRLYAETWSKSTRRTLYTRYRIRSNASASRYAVRYAPPVIVATIAAAAFTTQLASKHPKSQDFLRCIRADSPESPSLWSSFTTHVMPREKQQAPREYMDDADAPKSGEQPPPPQTPAESDRNGDSTGAEREDGAWRKVTNTVAQAPQAATAIGDTIVDYIVPDWMKLLPGFIRKLQAELSMAPGSLAEEIWYEANDPEINPEILWEASVRVSNDLCDDEKNFLNKRQRFTRRGLAKYLNIPEATIHPDDVPIIAMCGSGGGLRALVAGTSSYLSAQEAGLFDCVTYTAGVSGSCWLQTLYYSSLSGQSHQRLIRHLKNRLGVHIAFPPAAAPLLISAPTSKYLLSGLVEKAKGIPDAEFGIVDIYGLLLGARLLVPKGELSVNEYDFKISNQRRFTDDGMHPLPIYTAVRHEIPLEEQGDMKDRVAAEAKARREAWFQWFEFTPYEFWCEEVEAGIPTWAVGRKFENGRTVWRENGLALPELRTPLLMGIWGSAFCATMSHYYREIRPVLTSITGFGGIDDMISERDSDLIKLHPIDPAAIPNFAYSMRGLLPPSCPESLLNSPNLSLMDAGMSNNLPIYPLLRPGRNVDILIAFDASADVRTDNWLKVVDGYARQRGIKGWPVGAGWPAPDELPEEMAEDLEKAQAHSKEEAVEKITDAAKDQQEQRSKEVNAGRPKPKDLSYCNIWVGSTVERTTDEEPPPSKVVEEDWELMQNDAGTTVIYFPFLANPKVEGVDPRTSDFMSTWNFVYTPDQIDSVVKLARTNFHEGAERTKRTVRAVYERKKQLRLEREAEEDQRKAQWKLRQGYVDRRIGENDHGDHFS